MSAGQFDLNRSNRGDGSLLPDDDKHNDDESDSVVDLQTFFLVRFMERPERTFSRDVKDLLGRRIDWMVVAFGGNQ